MEYDRCWESCSVFCSWVSGVFIVFLFSSLSLDVELLLFEVKIWGWEVEDVGEVVDFSGINWQYNFTDETMISIDKGFFMVHFTYNFWFIKPLKWGAKRKKHWIVLTS